MNVRAHFGVLAVDHRRPSMTITHGDDPGPYVSTLWDAARDLAVIWAATIGGYAATYAVLTALARCFM